MNEKNVTPDIIIRIKGGFVQEVKKKSGIKIRIEIRDYDITCEDGLLKDKDGYYYSSEIY